LEVGSAFRIQKLLPWGGMVFSVHLYDQFTFQTYKVCNIGSYNMLTPEAHSKFIATKMLPKRLLSRTHSLPVLHGIILYRSIG